jgi:hypothetical protein
LNGPYHFLAYADDVNLPGDNTDTTKKSTETLLDARRATALEIKAEKTKYMLLSGYPNTGQTHDIKITNRSFKNESQFKYFGMTLTNQKLIH